MAKKSKWYEYGYDEGAGAAEANLTDRPSREDMDKYIARGALGEYIGEIREHQVQMAGDISYEVGQPGGPTERQYELFEEGFTDGFYKTVSKALKVPVAKL